MTTEINRDVAAKVLSIVDQGLVKGVGRPEPGEMCVEAAVCYALGLPHGDDPACVAPALRALKISLNDKAWSSNAARAKGMRRLAIVQLGTAGELDEKAFVAAVAEMTIRTFVPIALRAAASTKGNAAHKAKLEAAADRCEKEGTRDAAANAYAAATAAYAYAYTAATAATAAADAADATAAYADAAAATAAYAYAAATAYAAANAAAADAANAANAAAAYAANAAAAYAANAAAADAAYAAAYAAEAAANARSAKRDSILAQFAECVVQILVEMGVKSAEWLDLAPLEDAA